MLQKFVLLKDANQRHALLASALLGLLMFLLDILTPRGVATAIVYVPVIFCSLWFRRPHTAYVFALVCSLLTMAAFFLKSPSMTVDTRIIFANRGLAISVQWLVAVMVFYYRRMQDEVQLSTNHLVAVVESSHDAIIGKSLEGIVSSWNLGAEQIYGYKAEEAVGRHIDFLIPEDRRDEELYIINEIKHGRQVSNYETVRRTKDGRSIDISVTVSPIKDEAGTVVGASKIARNITERKQMEISLKNSEERYALAVQALSVGIWDWNVETNGLYWSPRFKEMLGVSADKGAMTYHDFESRLHPEDKVRTVAMLSGHIKRECAYDVEYRMQHDQGHYVPIHARGHASWDEQGRARRMVGSVEDVSMRKIAEAKIAAYTKALESSNKELKLLLNSNKQLDEFAFIASHDLKAPLRVIDNASKWLEADLAEHLTGENKENMLLLRGRVRRMEKLLDDLLEYARIGRDDDSRYRESLRGDELLEDIQELLAVPKSFCLKVSPAFADVTIKRMPLQQILLNLIGNALKHHDRENGSIEVAVKESATDYVFSVQDDGPGIAPQFHEQIFRMFQTLKPKDQVEGSGMGLAMVHKNLKLFGGTIHLESAEGRGSRFRFTWPKQQQLRLEQP
jgi:PAS domain S-box-containing protein